MESDPQKVADSLSKLIRGDVFADIIHRGSFSSDASIYRIFPVCVVCPRDADDIVAVVKYAAANKLPVVARGAGSGLAGESLCTGIVFDMTRYMNRIIEVSEDGKRVVCEPGVVMDALNSCLAGYGKKIGPDPSSSNRATIGGIIANNSTGAHSLQYGYIADYVESIEAVLADGSIVEFKNSMNPSEVKDEKVSAIAENCLSILKGKEEIIVKSLPKTKRNRCGYGIANIVHDSSIDLARLMSGSEGTLSIFTKITLKTVEVPAVKALLQLEFDSLDKMAKAVPVIVDSGVVTCDVMDKNVIKMAIESLPEYRDILPSKAEVVLLIEHIGSTGEQVQEKIDKTDLAVGNLASGRSVFFEPKQQKRVWKSRKDAVPLLYRIKSKKHPVEFIEDISVQNTKLAEYVAGLEKIKKKYGVSFSCYGHAGDGELHIRPNLNLGDDADLVKMRSIAEETFELAWSLGGSISGEHADGLLRAAYIRRQYGDEVYELFCKIKNIFDPRNLMNPGKILNSDADIMVKNLRAETKVQQEKLNTPLLFNKDELELELEQCSGCGVCLSREESQRMCPVFRALGEETASARSRANMLYLWASGQLSEKEFESEDFKKFLSMCINCKACSVQCPSGVDVSKLIAAARAEYAKRKGLKRVEFILSRNHYLSQIGSLFSPIANFVTGLGVFRKGLELAGGIDSRRKMPRFVRGDFLRKGRKYLATLPKMERPVDKVAYFVDTFVNFNEHDIGMAALKVLSYNGIEVILPEQRPAPVPAIIYGDVKVAKRDLEYNVKHLAKAVRDGYKIICSEPSAALCLKQEIRHFVDTNQARQVSENTYELMDYLLTLFKEGKLKPAGKTIAKEFIYHCPCHLMAIGSGQSSLKLLRDLCGVKVTDLGSGCCGLAGTFGMQKKNYELSGKISEKLRKNLEQSAIEDCLTECGACSMQIGHISRKNVGHPITVVAWAYGL